ncbi:MAG: hypothetical protein AAB670_02115, partial [Patescibacteria group bacterium]
VIPLMKAGKTPGGCKSKAECEAYCEDEGNIEACANFALEAGFMQPEEVEMFRKTGGKGPGGCKGRDGCEDFCNDPANQEVCFNFASEHGLIPPEELEQMKEGFQQFQQGIESAPPEVADCLKSSLGSETFEKLQSGRGLPGPQMGQAMRACFEDFARSQFEGGEGEGFGPPGFDGGEHPEGFGPPDGFEQFRGRGGEDFGPPEGVSPEDFERFREEGGFPGGGPSPSSGSSSGFPGGEGGGFPSEEEMERFQQEGFEQGGFENGRAPSPEELQNIIQQRTQEVIQQKTQEQQEQFERFGAPTSGGGPSPSSGSSSGGGFGPVPAEFNQQPSSGGFQQFSPSPSGGGSQPPPPASSALDVILIPFLNLMR